MDFLLLRELDLPVDVHNEGMHDHAEHDHSEHDHSEHDGMDKDGMDEDGMDKDGMDKDGMDEDGMHEDDMDKETKDDAKDEDHSDHDHDAEDKSADEKDDEAAKSDEDHSDHDHDDSSATGTTVGQGGDHSMHMGMSPFLFSKKTGFFVLFNEAFVTTTGGFVGALFGSFFFAILATIGYQIGKLVERRVTRSYNSNGSKAIPGVILGSIVHGFTQLLHYTAMLLVMTMNIWIIIAVILGHIVGYLIATIFGPTMSRAIAKEDPESSKLDGDMHNC